MSDVQRLHRTANQADPIKRLCLSAVPFLKPVGDVRETGGCTQSRTHVSTPDGGPSVAGRLIAGCVGEVIARRELKHARIPARIERFDADSVSAQVQALGSRAPGTGDRADRRRTMRSPAPCYRDGRASSMGLDAGGVIGANGAARRRFICCSRSQATLRRDPV